MYIPHLLCLLVVQYLPYHPWSLEVHVTLESHLPLGRPGKAQDKDYINNWYFPK